MSSQQEEKQKQAQWKPTATAEEAKLAPKDSDWNLPGATTTATRTRHGGDGRPSLRKNYSYSSKSSSDVSYLEVESSEEGEDDEAMLNIDEDSTRAPPTRIIIEVDQLKRTLEEFSLCKVCQGPMDVSLNAKGFGLATKIELSCLNPDCTFVHHGQEPAATKVHVNNHDGYDRLTDYAVNCIYVISFIASGDGPTEAEKLLGLLGMPNDTSMGSTTFKRIEDRVGPFIRDLADEILLENIQAEVKATLTNESNYDQWARSINPEVATPPLPKDRYPRIKGSFDNGWQQKSAGHKHDSPSGHGLIFFRWVMRNGRSLPWENPKLLFIGVFRLKNVS